MTNINDLINYRALSRYLSGGETNIRKEHIPNKYKYKVRLLMFFIEMWVNLMNEDK